MSIRTDKFQKIIVIGSPGAGKSTFSRKLRDITALPLYHLDMIKHKPDRTTITKEEFDKRLSEILSTDKWIIDGNYQRTIEIRLEKCDMVFLMDYPLEVCLAGAAARVGTKRDDLPWVENEFDEEFRQWIVDFPNEKLPHIYQMLDKYKGKNIIIFKSRQEADEYLQELEKEYRND
ncbi:MAG: adenylate kinase [Oscillospiraceae bacterium]|nr:adenylate kinase [Oscillospiraceae bacterium]